MLSTCGRRSRSTLLCAYAEDGNSMAPSKVCKREEEEKAPGGGDKGGGTACIPGCSPAGEQCHEVGRV